jgi:hypothetical protein
MQKQRRDARRLEHALWKAGAHGLTMQQLREVTAIGNQAFADAIAVVRRSELVEESKERRPDKRGHDREQVVFRSTLLNEEGSVPARLSRDPDVQELLAELALMEAISGARGAGRRQPRAIARWILAQPLLSVSDLSEWIDLETPLAEKIAALIDDGFDQDLTTA